MGAESDSHDPPRGARIDGPDALLTVGEAADLLGLAHVTLWQWIRSGRIAAQVGWRGGLEVDLICVRDLTRLDPTFQIDHRGPLRAFAGSSGGAASSAAEGAAVPLRAPSGVDQAEPGRAALDPSAAVERDARATWEAEASSELARLRAELADERARGRDRALELETVVRDLRRLLALSREGTSPHDPSGHEAPEHWDAEHWDAEPGARASGARASNAGRGTRATATPGALQLGALAAALCAGFALRPLVSSAWGPRASELEPPATERAPLGVVHQSAATPDPVLEAPLERAPEVPPSADPVAVAESHAPPPTAPDVTAEAPDPFTRAEFSGRLAAAEVAPLAYLAVDAPPCGFYALVRPGQALYDVLGPCMGPVCNDGASIAGTHRVDGIACCRHHQLAQRLGGDLGQLTEGARSAQAEGLLPPLVAARIDRATALFLRARFGPWRAAGVDSVDSSDTSGHRATIDATGAVDVHTWIELGSTMAPARVVCICACGSATTPKVTASSCCTSSPRASQRLRPPLGQRSRRRRMTSRQRPWSTLTPA
ncbi:MAG: helix-turn-helix domain-containing protein [Planctomycetota bacterium]